MDHIWINRHFQKSLCSSYHFVSMNSLSTVFWNRRSIQNVLKSSYTCRLVFLFRRDHNCCKGVMACRALFVGTRAVASCYSWFHHAHVCRPASLFQIPVHMCMLEPRESSWLARMPAMEPERPGSSTHAHTHACAHSSFGTQCQKV